MMAYSPPPAPPPPNRSAAKYCRKCGEQLRREPTAAELPPPLEPEYRTEWSVGDLTEYTTSPFKGSFCWGYTVPWRNFWLVNALVALLILLLYGAILSYAGSA